MEKMADLQQKVQHKLSNFRNNINDDGDILTELKNDVVEILPDFTSRTSDLEAGKQVSAEKPLEPINLADYNINPPLMPSAQEQA